MRVLTGVALLLAIGVASLLGPVSVQAQDEGVVSFAPVTSMQGEYALSVNGVAAQVCQARWETANRRHLTCEDLVTDDDLDLVAGRVRETILYDGIFYLRVDDEDTWVAEAVPELGFAGPTVNLLFQSRINDLGDVTVINLGPVIINGVTTTQYQYRPAGGSGTLVYDVFVTADGLVLKDEFSLREIDDGSVTVIIADVWTYRSFDVIIIVTPPPPELVIRIDVDDGDDDDDDDDDGDDDDDDDDDD